MIINHSYANYDAASLFVPPGAEQIVLFKQKFSDGREGWTFYYRMSPDSPKRRVDVLLRVEDVDATEYAPDWWPDE